MVENYSGRRCSSHFMKLNLEGGKDLINIKLVYLTFYWMLTYIYLYRSHMCSYYFVFYFSHLTLFHVNPCITMSPKLVVNGISANLYDKFICSSGEFSLSLVALLWTYFYKLIFKCNFIFSKSSSFKYFWVFKIKSLFWVLLWQILNINVLNSFSETKW